MPLYTRHVIKYINVTSSLTSTGNGSPDRATLSDLFIPSLTPSTIASLPSHVTRTQQWCLCATAMKAPAIHLTPLGAFSAVNYTTSSVAWLVTAQAANRSSNATTRRGRGSATHRTRSTNVEKRAGMMQQLWTSSGSVQHLLDIVYMSRVTRDM